MSIREPYRQPLNCKFEADAEPTSPEGFASFASFPLTCSNSGWPDPLPVSVELSVDDGLPPVAPAMVSRLTVELGW